MAKIKRVSLSRRLGGRFTWQVIKAVNYRHTRNVEYEYYFGWWVFRFWIVK